MAYDKMHLSVGSVRCANERRQYGALLMVSGVVAVLAPLGNIVSALDLGEGLLYTDPSSIEFWGFLGSLCFLLIGISATTTGFAECIHDYGTTKTTSYAILITQLAWIPYITDMVSVGKAATKDAPQFWFYEAGSIGMETAREMTTTDVKFVAAMGIMGLLSYGFMFIGAIAFMQFSLYTFQTAIPEDRNSSYFAGRLCFYSLVLCMAGISQLMLGSYLLTNFDMDNGKLSGGYVQVGLYTILYPSMSMVVGGLQVINGLWGFARSLDVAHGGPDDILYAFSMAFQWMVMLSIQIIVQMGFAGDNTAAGASSVAAIFLGLNLMPPYLDYKMRNTLQDIPIDYYGCSDEFETEHALE